MSWVGGDACGPKSAGHHGAQGYRLRVQGLVAHRGVAHSAAPVLGEVGGETNHSWPRGWKPLGRSRDGRHGGPGRYLGRSLEREQTVVPNQVDLSSLLFSSHRAIRIARTGWC